MIGIGAISAQELIDFRSCTLSELLRGWSVLMSKDKKESSSTEAGQTSVAENVPAMDTESIIEQSLEDFKSVQAVKSGDRDAFAFLVRRYETRVRGYCARMLRSSTEAEDAAQEVFIKAFRSLHLFRGDASFSSWLYRIAANHCIDLSRKERIRSWFRFPGATVADGMKSDPEQPSAADSTVSASTRQILEQVLAALPAAQRSLIILREGQGLSYEQLAQTLEISVDSVKAHLKRARKKLFAIRAEIETKIEREQGHE